MQAQTLGRLPDLSLYAETASYRTRCATTVPSFAYKRLIAGVLGFLLFAGSLGTWVYMIGFRLHVLSPF